ncbi:hypothetical protein COY28_04900 [Candidatus Woesearchaeota archaeon CG_4_10_14_0_2_um_filter_57_5]|nr:MAG: hypothetical protein AUJ68_03750 [Candidatus Woesearchaeota archaeon CG1_02_57_44]PIN69073.1 MAG: hypothetical protein COV94_03350 [Candidatus Woesearchaeota archaeon CG11_big_fil_rev_8_21_14_0_20_57_5]PIZ51669.1 MAG: hypothetical protein COY28_04900 [Candidatus Woesearchaeota archaeon CG_4_10_14_0_2_um_filter_57_5]
MTRHDAAAGFQQAYRGNLYDGFSHGTPGQWTTPFLEATLAVHQEQFQGSSVGTLEGGAGRGYHSVTIVRNTHGGHHTANEYDPATAAGITALAKQHLNDDSSRLSVVPGDLVMCLQDAGDLGLFYANSVLHFFSPDERDEVYGEVASRQPAGGLVAVSFKGYDDALRTRGQVVEQTAAGPIVRSHDDGIERLFVSQVDPLITELSRHGYAVQRPIAWAIPDYNMPGEDSHFVGLIGVRGH